MESIGLPFGYLYRVWVAGKANPCTIEMVRPELAPDEGYLRVRNDSSLPVQIFSIDFRWRPRGSTKFSEFYTPLVWLLSDNDTRVLEPGHSFEHPVDAHELGFEATHGKIYVEHNRSNRPSTKKFKVRGATAN